jgi:uncharacterized Zn finger protein (UPF0148 family)
MRELSSLRCENCGTALERPVTGSGPIVCPVCQFVNEVGAVAQTMPLTPDDLEEQLGALIDHARTSGMELEEIVRVLRDELEFTAELASNGRNLSVQIIDLGPLESQGLRRPVRDRSAVLRGRVVDN